ncbi:MAG: DNA translocase FtsK [Minisyncoccia bacterium]
MSKKNKKTQEKSNINSSFSQTVHPEVKKNIVLVILIGITIILILAAMSKAGPAGDFIYNFLIDLFGWGYYTIPFLTFIIAFNLSYPLENKKIFLPSLVGGILFLLGVLGFIDLISPGNGGLVGNIVGLLKIPFGQTASLVIILIVLVVAFLILLNRPIKIKKPEKKSLEVKEENEKEPIITVSLEEEPKEQQNYKQEQELKIKSNLENKEINKNVDSSKKLNLLKTQQFKNYVAPPLSLLNSNIDHPTSGDLRANANIIKRTLESFGLVVEMGEISIGPTITRYTLKPAEGIKLSKITALSQDLSLALAAHPIRIEAPIPGKSLVGIEVPNKSAALVRLGSLLQYPEYQNAPSLTFCLGRDVSGEPVFADIAKMPHLLIAGATGSGKSIMVHSIIISLLFKNSPNMLRLLMVDPKRVELSVYNDLPHLLAPVVVENKKAINILRWIIKEMDDRYEKLLRLGARDIKSYNQKSQDQLPYILIIIDELADLMVFYGREVESAIIRLAQMSRATGIHLIVSTQRPSVEVITGLIKANITSRIALQVASQVDSRTILDMAGAEKLLGNGDLLYISGELSKPKRIQGAYISEDEIKKVVKFIKENNSDIEKNNVDLESQKELEEINKINLDNLEDNIDDELYEEAVETVRLAKKASASLLQRKLKIGYARAARLLDIMEQRGIVGPADGAKPRDVFIE